MFDPSVYDESLRIAEEAVHLTDKLLLVEHQLVATHAVLDKIEAALLLAEGEEEEKKGEGSSRSSSGSGSTSRSIMTTNSRSGSGGRGSGAARGGGRGSGIRGGGEGEGLCSSSSSSGKRTKEGVSQTRNEICLHRLEEEYPLPAVENTKVETMWGQHAHQFFSALSDVEQNKKKR